MELWGAHLYGDPCRGCGFAWPTAPAEAVAFVAAVPARFEELVRGRRGDEQLPELAWNVSGYVAHVADNLRNWAERLTAARLSGLRAAPDCDQDLLARARGCNGLPLPGALWSLHRDAAAWSEAVTAALAAEVELDHATRGVQRAEDVARNNAHDAAHHLWDVARILRAGRD